MVDSPTRLVLIDGHALIYRAYHAFPAELQTSQGEQTNAIYGFTSILLNTIKELKPKYMAVAFDKKGPTFRHKKYIEYKATRIKPDKEMLMQIPRIKQIVKALNIPIFEERGFEADDVIGSLAFQASNPKIKNEKSAPKGGQAKMKNTPKELVNLTGQANKISKTKEKKPIDLTTCLPARPALRPYNLDTIIVTGDQDALQLVSDKVKVWMPPRGKFIPAKTYDSEAVAKKFGIKPEQIVDYKALVGDSSDNIPGVVGIGPKTAGGLLNEYKTLDNIYKNLNKIPKKVKVKLKKGKKSAYLSKDLAVIHTDAPVRLELKACTICDYDKKKTIKLFEELEFKSLIKRLPADGWEEMAGEIFKIDKSKSKVDKSSKQSPASNGTGKADNQMGLFK